MGLRERIMQYISYKRMTVQMFELKTGISNGAVAKMGDNTRRSTLDKISNKFPDLNKAWLLTGEGEMLNDTSSTSNVANSDRHGTSVAGNGNNVNATSALEKALESLMEQQRITVKAQEQIDRLLALLEKR